MSTTDSPTGRPEGGCFIAFEGPDGCGKSTHARRLAEALRAVGTDVHLTREPGGTDLGERLRDLVLDPQHAPIGPRTEALLFAAARAAHAEQTLRPALQAGTTVITDRYIDSSVAYQGAGRGLGVQCVAELNAWATEHLVPDVTVVLDLDAATAARRRQDRQDAGGDGPDRMEREIADAHESLRAAFLARAAAAPQRYLVLHADQDADVLAAQLLGGLAEHGVPGAAAALAGRAEGGVSTQSTPGAGG